MWKHLLARHTLLNQLERSDFAETIKQEEFYAEKKDLENLLSRTPTTAKEFAEEVYRSR
nr:hypothetical protein [uncultured Chryseobacterium sp.]